MRLTAANRERYGLGFSGCCRNCKEPPHFARRGCDVKIHIYAIGVSALDIRNRDAATRVDSNAEGTGKIQPGYGELACPAPEQFIFVQCDDLRT